MQKLKDVAVRRTERASLEKGDPHFNNAEQEQSSISLFRKTLRPRIIKMAKT